MTKRIKDVRSGNYEEAVATGLTTELSKENVSVTDEMLEKIVSAHKRQSVLASPKPQLKYQSLSKKKQARTWQSVEKSQSPDCSVESERSSVSQANRMLCYRITPVKNNI
jgi:hypothetical protein